MAWSVPAGFYLDYTATNIMSARIIKPGVWWVGALDFNRRVFDALVPTPDGTSYNAYLVQGSEKTVLVDTVDTPKSDTLLRHLQDTGMTGLDYVVINHAEQDHSGALPEVLERFPALQVVTNQKCKDQLLQFYDIPGERFLIVKDRAQLSLGNRTLEFIFAPWVHWPETMFTYLKEDRILFSCDFLGSHLATSELFVRDPGEIYEPSKLYFAEIMMPFRNHIKAHLEKLAALPIDIVAPSHGPLHRPPQWIVDHYRQWTGDAVLNEVVIPYASMHGSTEKMVDFLSSALMRRGVNVRPFDLTVADTGKLSMALVDAATVVFATPTVLFGPHPHVVSAAYLTNLLKPKTRFVGILGSYGWAGKAVDILTQLLNQMQAEMIPPVFIKGAPRHPETSLIDKLASEIAARHQAIGLLPV